ncbi:plastid division protein PDV1-like [Nymphaea colorata]|nr:plastid division protein PDV1-like [Nymphaea colorata]
MRSVSYMGAENLNASIQKSEELHEKLEAAIRRISEQHAPSLFPDLEESLCFCARQGHGGRLQLEPCEFPRCPWLECRSLAAIRDALRVFQEWLRFLERLETQQHVERCAALVRFEQTRQFLIHRLVEHNGRDFSVIQQALEFARANGEVANICSEGPFADNKTLRLQKNSTGSNVKLPKGFVSLMNSSLQVMMKPLKLQKAAGVILRLGVAASGLLLALKLQGRCQTSLKVLKIMPKTNAGHRRKSQFLMNSAIGGRAQQIQSFSMDVSHGRG